MSPIERGGGGGGGGANPAVSRGAVLVNTNGVAAQNVIAWRAPYSCTVTALKGYRVAGSGVTVNAGKGTTAVPANKILAADLSVTSTETWTDGGAVQNTAFVAGDPLVVIVQTVTGSPTEISVQVDFSVP